MKYLTTGFVIVSLSLLIAGCEQSVEQTVTVPEKSKPAFGELSVYEVVGSDARGDYSGRVVLVVEPETDGRIVVLREIQYGDEMQVRYSGHGSLKKKRLTFSFNALLPPVASDKALPFSELERVSIPGNAESGRLQGDVIGNGRRVEATVQLRSGKQVLQGREQWTLEQQPETPTVMTHKMAVNPAQWNAVDLPVDGPGMVQIRVQNAATPYGVFLPKGETPPEWKPDPTDDRPLPFFGKSRISGAPQVQTPFEGASWSRDITKMEAERDWVFWWRDDILIKQQKFEFEIRYLPSPWWFLFCNPWVKIDITPNTVSVDEPININVQAHAWAGLEMFWWFGSGTGITELDRAHIQSGMGASFGNHDWTIQISQPGTYTFGANARDVLYPVAGQPHQASEGCGLSYDTVAVVSSTSRSYSVAFILLAPQGTDTSSPAFQTLLNRVNTVKAQLPDQFSRSTDGRGTADVSYPTVVIIPDGTAYGVTDSANMWPFLRDTMTNQFYSDHPDDFDFLAIYEIYPDIIIGSRHLGVRSRVAGFGISPYDTTAIWGSAGRLRGVGLVRDANDLPDSYDFANSRMHLLLHEVFGHQWGVFAQRLSKPGSHFDIGIESPNFTVLYGRPWIKIDDNNYTTADIQDPVTGFTKVIFHPWMMYVSGMKLRSEIPQSLFDVEPDTPPASRYSIVTTTGTSETVTLQSIIDDSGDRYDVP